jgi:hypothetical protein
MSMAGYSGKPLSQKLGVKAGDAVVAIGASDHYGDLLAPPAGGRTDREG